jgi:hypothetical protein
MSERIALLSERQIGNVIYCYCTSTTPRHVYVLVGQMAHEQLCHRASQIVQQQHKPKAERLGAPISI